MHFYIQETRIAFQHSSAGGMRCSGNLSLLRIFSQTKFQRIGGVLFFFKKKTKKASGVNHIQGLLNLARFNRFSWYNEPYH